MADLENKSVEELVMAVQHSEAAVVTLPEKIITITISVVADILEIIVFLEIATGVLGISIWLMSYIFGFCVSVALFMWSLFRGVNGSFFVKRILILLLGFILDEATAGVFPIRTITLLIVIYLNNHFEMKKQGEVMELLERGVKFLEAYA